MSIELDFPIYYLKIIKIPSRNSLKNIENKNSNPM